MIIFGTKGKSALLGVLFFVCSVCGNEAAQRLVKHTRWFTLFFLPVFPYSTKHVYTCAYCGAGTELDAQAADRFEADAAHAAGARGGPTG